jgi:hypothetical protein
MGHTDRCYRGLGVLAVTRLRVDARERWFEGEQWFGGDSAGAQAGQRITGVATGCAASRERYNNLYARPMRLVIRKDDHESKEGVLGGG